MPRLLGEKLRALRQRRQLSLVDLAQRLGLRSHAHLSTVETGARDPSLSLVVQLADVFGVSLDYLLRDEPPLADPPPSINTSPPYQPFGAQLRALRYQRGLNQRDLAEQLQLQSQAYLSNLESGRREPSIETVLRTAAFFAVSVDTLLRSPRAVHGEAIEP